MKLIVGIGNPGPKFHNTRHNLGFIALDSYATEEGITDKRNQFDAEVLSHSLNEHPYMLIKPHTYVNLSGTSVCQLLAFYKLTPLDLLVIYDDASLDLGHYKLSFNSSDGGHNGIKNTIQELGTKEFLRLRVGIATPEKQSTIIEHFVLGKFLPFELEIIKSMSEKFRAIIKDFVFGDNQIQMMNKHNYSIKNL